MRTTGVQSAASAGVLLLGMVLLVAATASCDDAEGTLSPLRSAAEVAYPPFSFVGADGEATGFSVELLRAAMEAMGREVRFATAIWPEVRGWLADGEVDALPLVGRTPEREAIFDFTVPYMTLHGAIVVRDDTRGIRTLDDLAGKEVAVMEKDNAEEFLRREARDFSIVTTPSFEAALSQLAAGQHDAVVMQRLVALRLLDSPDLANLRVVNRPIDGFHQDFCFAVKEGDRKTLALLNEGLALVAADGTQRHLHSRWFAALELPSRGPIVIGGDWNFPPFEYLDGSGRPIGRNVDLARAVARSVGLEIEIRLGPWNDVMEQMHDGEIDALAGLFYTPTRDLSDDFSPQHTTINYVAVSRRDADPPPVDLASLTGHSIAVQSGDIAHEFALAQGLGDQLSVYPSQEDALREVARGRHDCALVARLTALHWIDRHGWDNLVLGTKPLLSPSYCFAVPAGHEALLAQFSDGLRIIEESGEFRAINDRWLGLEASPLDLATILRWLALVAIPLLLIILASLGWSWSLRKQVATRTAALRRSEELMRSLVVCSPVPLFGVDNEGRVVTWNEAAERVFGWSAVDVVGQPLPIVPEDRWEEADRINAEIRATGLCSDREVVRLKKDGSRFPGILSGATIRDTSGQVIGIMASIEDITARKTAEEARRESEERFRMLVESSPDAIFVQVDGCFAYLNEATARLLGAGAAADLVGRDVLESIHPDDRDEVSRRLHDLDEGRQPDTSWQEQFLRLDGGEVPAEVTAVPIQFEGRDGALVFMRDISDRLEADAARRELEQRLAQVQRMESVGRLAGGVAHDFNNMLSVISGNAELALDAATSAADGELGLYIGEILTAARRSTDITRQLLAFASRQTIAPRALDLNTTVESTLKMLRRLIGEDIELIWTPGQELWRVKLDPSQVDQILANLCVNARDAIGGVGTIKIATENVVIDETGRGSHSDLVCGEYVQFRVSDDGCGMSDDVVEKVFEPFFTTKEMGRGTGLGLATVYGIVKQNDGDIDIETGPGEGTVVTVLLPRHTGAAAEDADQQPAELPRARGETILLVEDDPAILEMSRQMLTGLGYTVLTAGVPDLALSLAAEHGDHIELLITDVVMPGMNGRELANHLVAGIPTLRTLFMSGYTADVIAHRGVLDAGVQFVQKPFSLMDLAVKVRRTLDGDGGRAEVQRS